MCVRYMSTTPQDVHVLGWLSEADEGTAEMSCTSSKGLLLGQCQTRLHSPDDDAHPRVSTCTIDAMGSAPEARIRQTVYQMRPG